ncbi:MULTISPECIES: GNAT family N-acetyltransferase [Amycolatopsis]|uniref:GNAT family N-acetyltransferase n=1 Tax=Amycolatopsis TaxID=1813 RepID=UPI001E5E5B65|nr:MULTISPECIES: GNAT family N-acetyltransferase [Amycolatopsis]
MRVALRPATEGDREFCFRLHEAAMGAYVAAVWGWDEREQRAYHDRGFAPGRWRIVTVDGADAGMLSVEHRPGSLYLGRIELLPEFQGRGVGSLLITDLIADADRHEVAVELDVLAVNTRARALYRRLGFREVRRHGDGDRKITMRYHGTRTGTR